MSLEKHPYIEMNRNYPLNCWWVAAFSKDIEEKLHSTILLNIPVLLYRRKDGHVVSMEDRCPHRSLPLSMGTLKDDHITCGYHGFVFGPDGNCKLVPSTGHSIPACVKTYPVIESAPFIWIYLGDAEQLNNIPPPPKIDWCSDSSFVSRSGTTKTDCNYLLLKENVLDLTHVGYIHAKSFKVTDIIKAPPFEMTEETVGYRQEYKGSPLAALYAEPLGIKPGTPYDRKNWGDFVSPALQTGGVDIIPPGEEKYIGRLRIIHATTPINNRETMYFWMHSRDHGNSDAEFDAYQKIVIAGYEEDKDALAAIQKRIDQLGYDPGVSVSVKADTGGVLARRIIDRWMKRETIVEPAMVK